MQRDKTFESPVPTLFVVDMWLQNEQLAEHREDFVDGTLINTG